MSNGQPSTLDRLKAEPRFAGLRRSLDVYYGDVEREIAMDALYGRFLTRSALAFDIGAHVGDRIASFRRLGARVVALEPQPDCMAVLDALYCCDGAVTLVGAACGTVPGSLTLHVNSSNPTVTTASTAFIEAAAGAGGWEGGPPQS